MPELPEIIITVEKLQLMVGSSISQIEFFPINSTYYEKVFKEKPTIIKITYSAKKILILTSGININFSLGLTGKVLFLDEPKPDRHTRMILAVNDHNCTLYLHLVDERGFGRVGLFSKDAYEELRSITGSKYRAIFLDKSVGRNTPVFNVLTDQNVTPGVGSYLAQEALHLDRMNPMKRKLTVEEVASLYKCLSRTIKLSLLNGGATWGNFLYPDGTTGNFYKKLAVYGREGLPCLSCGVPLRASKINGRNVTYCPTCQSL